MLNKEINVISPYKRHGIWVFDDARVGLVQEPFVSDLDMEGWLCPALFRYFSNPQRHFTPR